MAERFSLYVLIEVREYTERVPVCKAGKHRKDFQRGLVPANLLLINLT